MMPFTALLSLLLLVAVAIATTSSVVFAQTASPPAPSSSTCNSNFHMHDLSTTIRNPPIDGNGVDAGTLPETAAHYQIECAIVTQEVPAGSDRSCFSEAGQSLRLCHAFTSGPNSGNWTCDRDVSALFNNDRPAGFPLKIGGNRGPELQFKFVWAEKTTVDASGNVVSSNIASCFPRKINIRVVALPVPVHDPEFTVSMVFVAVVVIVTIVFLSYGAYALYRTSMKFEHRIASSEGEAIGTSPRAAAVAAGGGRGGSSTAGKTNSARRRMQAKATMAAALKAMGVPETFGASLYDEDVERGVSVHSHREGDGEEGGEEENNGDEMDGEQRRGDDEEGETPAGSAGRRQQQQRQQHLPYGSSASAIRRPAAEDIEHNDDDYDDGDEEDGEGDEGDWTASTQGRGAYSGASAPATVVLDNNQVIQATGSFIPWYEREQQQKQQRQQPQRGPGTAIDMSGRGRPPPSTDVNRSLAFEGSSSPAALTSSSPSDQRIAQRGVLPPASSRPRRY